MFFNMQVSGIPKIGKRCILKIDSGALVKIGKDCTFDRDVEIVVYSGGHLMLGDHVYIGHGSTIACADSIVIGSDTLIGDLVSIRDMNHRRVPGVPLRQSGIVTRPIQVGKNCWLGSKVTVVAGCKLGNEVTVAANAVVTGQFGDELVIGGVPARVLKNNQ